MKVLVIEDDKDCAEYLRDVLSFEGYLVDVAYTGEEGESLADNFNYDCILLDILLPEKDGFAVCRDLRKKKNNTPIIMITGKKDTIEDMVQGLDYGADDYLIKPIISKTLHAKLRALRRREPIIKNVILEAGNIVINTATKQVWREQKEIMLTIKEYAILEYLARYANMNINRITLEQQAWPLTMDVTSNVLEAHIKNLRAKLDPEHEGFIQTIKGIGYRLNTA